MKSCLQKKKQKKKKKMKNLILKLHKNMAK